MLDVTRNSTPLYLLLTNQDDLSFKNSILEAEEPSIPGNGIRRRQNKRLSWFNDQLLGMLKREGKKHTSYGKTAKYSSRTRALLGYAEMQSERLRFHEKWNWQGFKKSAWHSCNTHPWSLKSGNQRMFLMIGRRQMPHIHMKVLKEDPGKYGPSYLSYCSPWESKGTSPPRNCCKPIEADDWE